MCGGQLRQVGVGFLHGAIAGIAGDARSRTRHRLLELRNLCGALPVHHDLNPRGEQFPVLGSRKLRDQRPLRVVHLPDIQPPTQAAQLRTVGKGNLGDDDERLGRCVWNKLPGQRRGAGAAGDWATATRNTPSHSSVAAQKAKQKRTFIAVTARNQNPAH